MMPSLTLGSVCRIGSMGNNEGPPDLLTYPFSKTVSIKYNPILSAGNPRGFFYAR